jgi:hypothetical protein
VTDGTAATHWRKIAELMHNSAAHHASWRRSQLFEIIE